MSTTSEARVVCHLGRLLEERGMTLAALSDHVGVTVANLSVLKNGRARAVRFSTLTAVCQALGCTVGDLLEVTVEQPGRAAAAGRQASQASQASQPMAPEAPRAPAPSQD